MIDGSLSEFLVGESASLKDAMNRIDRVETGMVIVVDDGRLVGTATDGDIRRSILSGSSLDTPIGDVMTEDPVYIRQDWSPETVTDHLRGASIHELVPEHRMLLAPVVDEDRRVVDLAYVTREGDLSRTLLDTVATSDPALRSGNSADINGVSSVLIIGGAGYIGSVLSRKFLEAGYRVRVLDNLTYGDHGIVDLYDHERFRLIEGDMRSIEAVVESIRGVDAVIHLGALVGDPASAIDPQKTLELNYHAVRLAASICKYHQVNRFVFASTCSVYGESEHPDDLLTEQSSLNPVSLYAKSKIESERAVLEMEDENFSPTVFRMATVYGLSPRMRFDLVVNVLSAKAYTEGTIPIFGGEQYRPNVHVADAAQAYLDCVETPIETVSGETYNIGSTEQNYRIVEVGEIVESCFSGAEIDRRPEQEDERTYRVDFSKVSDELGFEADHTVADCCREIRAAFDVGRFEDFTATKYHNYESLQEFNPIFDPDRAATTTIPSSDD